MNWLQSGQVQHRGDPKPPQRCERILTHYFLCTSRLSVHLRAHDEALTHLLWLEVVLSAASGVLLVCHAKHRHLDMPVVCIVLEAISKG